MSLFTSARERRLWLWAIAVMVAIYSTLGPARVVVDVLRERNLLRLAFLVVVLAVLVAIVIPWVKRRPGWREIGVALGVGLAYGMTFLRIENPAERTHLLEYGVVAALIHQALLERRRNGHAVPIPAALTVGATALLGLLDELIQALLPSRVFDWWDVLFNALAGFMVVVARLAMAPVLLPGWRLWFLWLLAGGVGWGWCMDPGLFGLTQRHEIVGFALDLPPFPSVAAGSALVGALHWLVLRRYVPYALWWLPASIGGAAAAAVVVYGVGLVDTDLGLSAGVLLYGTLAGAVQWVVLRREVRRAGWWVLASTVGWLVAVPWGPVAGPPGWAVFSAVTGTVLVWLLRPAAHVAAR